MSDREPDPAETVGMLRATFVRAAPSFPLARRWRPFRPALALAPRWRLDGGGDQHLVTQLGWIGLRPSGEVDEHGGPGLGDRVDVGLLISVGDEAVEGDVAAGARLSALSILGEG